MAKPGSPWTQKELDFLVRNYTKLTTKQLAAKLGRPYGGVAWKIQDLNLPDEATYSDLQNEMQLRRSGGRVEIEERTVGVPQVVVDPKLSEPTKPWWKFW